MRRNTDAQIPHLRRKPAGARYRATAAILQHIAACEPEAAALLLIIARRSPIMYQLE
jgi:hypothetical protein